MITALVSSHACQIDLIGPPYEERARQEKAKEGLASGMEYSRAIRNRRVRAATVLPALIGARTLALLNAAGPAALQRKVKVPRREVRAMILSLGVAFASCRRIDAMFDRAKL